MKIEIDSYYYGRPYGILGRAGEIGIREILCTFPRVEGASFYKLRFELGGGESYDVDITEGAAATPASLLAHAGLAKCQWMATAPDGNGGYSIVAKSNIMRCCVLPSVSSDVVPVPTYEQAVDALESIKGVLNRYQVKSQIISAVEYESADSHDTSTLYFVLNGSRVKMYLGDMELAGANKDQGTIICLTAQKQLTAGSYTVIPGEET